MSIKKILVLAATGIASSAALAGGPVKYTAPAAMPASANNNTGVYIEGLVGYNRYTFDDALPATGNASWDNGSGNWSFAADVGYQFQRYFSAELGGIYTLKAKYTNANGDSVNVQPWYAYLAGKMSVPVYDNISVFAKLGAGYQKIKNSNENLTNGLYTSSNWGPMFGAGVAYNITPEFYITGQWLRFTGKIKDATINTTAPNIFLLGAGYKFAM